MAIASRGRAREVTRPRLVLTVGVALAIAHIIAFAQNLRRYTVGYNGELQYWKQPQWSPPFSPLLLTILYAVVVSAFVAWLLVGGHVGDGVRADSRAGSEASLLAPATAGVRVDA
jgi:hypothetical protein